ncbi:MAG: chemotaxis protein CheX [Planctomycetota bacterium]|nr:chemotaxis protein CheX [Planctomycetota bacterium]
MGSTRNADQLLTIDPTLMGSVIEGTQTGLQMTGVTPPPVGASCTYATPREISVLVGFVGEVSGTLTINLSKQALLYLSGKLLLDQQVELGEDSFDAICEIGNMIAGSVKDALLGTAYQVDQISIPSLVLGTSYDVFSSRGMTNVSVEFELEEIPVINREDRFFSACLSLMTSAS